MTWLEACQEVAREVGASTDGGPSAVTGQEGELARIVHWVKQANDEVQRKHDDWLFMRGSFSFQTVSGTAAYTPTDAGTSSFRRWELDKFKIYLTSSGVAGETPLEYIDYDTWYSLYSTGTQTASYPIDITVLPNLSISLGPKPNAIYTVTGEYTKRRTQFSASSDEPVFPAEYHQIIVYKAMMKYGVYTGAPEILASASGAYHELLGELERTQLPELLMAGPQVG